MSGVAVPDSLRSYLQSKRRIAVAFSGGTDSTYLLYAALECGIEVKAYTVRSAFQPKTETERAIDLAKELGTETKIIDVDILSDPSITANPEDRCYFCKKHIFSAIKQCASNDGYEYIADATNASDDPSGRPGMRALEEMGILSPLRICGIGKPEIRRLSRLAGLPTWNTPSNSCLATRIPCGMRIDGKLLERTEAAEEELHALGLRDIRVRTTDDGARLETTADESHILESVRDEAEEILLKYYPSVSYSERKPGL